MKRCRQRKLYPLETTNFIRRARSGLYFPKFQSLPTRSTISRRRRRCRCRWLSFVTRVARASGRQNSFICRLSSRMARRLSQYNCFLTRGEGTTHSGSSAAHLPLIYDCCNCACSLHASSVVFSLVIMSTLWIASVPISKKIIKYYTAYLWGARCGCDSSTNLSTTNTKINFEKCFFLTK